MISTPDDHFAAIKSNLKTRHRVSRIWRSVYLASTLVAILFLIALMVKIINDVAGYVALENTIEPATLSTGGVPLKQVSLDALVTILKDNVSPGVIRRLEREQSLLERSRSELYDLVIARVVEPKIVETWSLYDSLFHRTEIEKELAANNPAAYLEFRVWINPRFLVTPQSSQALYAGVRTAILGSIFTIIITILVAFPLGVGAAIYLEEYAQDNALNRLIQTNINNLAGIPSIIYGMLGLAIFVRTLGAITSGAAFGFSDPSTANGRTVLSAGLTLAVLVLPLIIINGQEAIRSVPNSLREASYGIGATRWQTVWAHVLPGALPGILTGTILAVSRAIGETAPLVVVGASTFIDFDPTSPFSKFTTLPIQIYQWVTRAQGEFRNLAAAAIIVLMILLLTTNAFAIILRNRFSRRT